MSMEMQIFLWGITTTGGVVAVFWKLKSDVRHLDDTKENKNGLGKKVAELDTTIQRLEDKVVRFESKVERMEAKIERMEVKIERVEVRIEAFGEKVEVLPCIDPPWKQTFCEMMKKEAK